MWRLWLLLIFVPLLSGCHMRDMAWLHLRANTPADSEVLTYSVCGPEGADQLAEAQGVEYWNHAANAMGWRFVRTGQVCGAADVQTLVVADGYCRGFEACWEWAGSGGALLRSFIKIEADTFGAPDSAVRALYAHEFGHAIGPFHDHAQSNCAFEDAPTIMGQYTDCDMPPYPNDELALMCHYGYCDFGGGLILATGSYPDYDFDTVPDADDNCISAPNPLQEDRDSDGQGGPCDSDDDGDGFSDQRELGMGTDRGDSCRDTAGHDAWPLDVTVNGIVNTVDVGRFVPALGGSNPRLDFNGIGGVNTIDVGRYVGNLGRNCLTEQASQLLDVRKAVEAYGDWTQAVPDGYEWGTAYRPGYGTWMMRQPDGAYDPYVPEGLIYGYDTSGQERLLGVFWMADAPGGGPGIWRHYQDVCVDSGHVPHWPSTSCDGILWPDVGYGATFWFDNPNGMFEEENPDA